MTFEIGQEVKTTGIGGIFPNYKAWAENFGLKNYRPNKYPNQANVVVIATGKHLKEDKYGTIYGITQNGIDYIIDGRFLRALTEEEMLVSTKITLPSPNPSCPSTKIDSSLWFKKSICHAMTFEFPNGDVISVPGPKEEIREEYKVEKLEYRDRTDSFVLFDYFMPRAQMMKLSNGETLRFLNIQARQIIKEYRVRINLETPRILSYTVYRVTVLRQENNKENSYKTSFPVLKEFLG